MGFEYSFRCKKCRKEYSARLDDGDSYPPLCTETMENAKKGKYGKEWQEIILTEKDAKINDKIDLYRCRSCGYWKTNMNLSLYRIQRKPNMS